MWGQLIDSNKKIKYQMTTCLTVVHLPNQLNFSPITLPLLPSVCLILTFALSVCRYSVNGKLDERDEIFLMDVKYVGCHSTDPFLILGGNVHEYAHTQY